jgi:Fe-Mn family superoxide dismutase
MKEFNRRIFMKSLTLAAASVPVLGTRPVAAQGQNTVQGAFQTDAEPKPLNFDPAQLESLSANLINSHWQNNYGGSVRALNTIKQQITQALADDNTPAFLYNDLKREHLMRMGSVVLHEYYFDNMAPPGSRDSELDRMLAQAFGSVANWEKEFRRIGAGLGGGSGWVMLGWNTHTQTLENYWMWDHMHAPAATMPILLMDMYEHSYHMDFGAATNQYIDAFMRNINWAVVADRLDQALTG